VGQNVGPLLAGLGAGAASAYSPYAARGINTAANVISASAENRYRQAQEQRVQQALAKEANEERRRQQLGTQINQFVDRNTEFGPPFNPPQGGIGTGIDPQAAQLAKLTAIVSPGASLSYLEQRLGEAGKRGPAPMSLEDIQRLPLTPGTRVEATSAEGLKTTRELPKAEPRKIRFDVYDDPRGYRMQSQTDEATGEMIRQTRLGRVRVPSDISIQAFTDETGNRIVTGIAPGGGVTFQKTLGRVGEKGGAFSGALFRKNLSMRKNGLSVDDPEVQALDPIKAGQVLKDLSGTNNLLELLLGAEGGGEQSKTPKPKEGAAPTAQEEADRYLLRR